MATTPYGSADRMEKQLMGGLPVPGRTMSPAGYDSSKFNSVVDPTTGKYKLVPIIPASPAGYDSNTYNSVWDAAKGKYVLVNKITGAPYSAPMAGRTSGALAAGKGKIVKPPAPITGAVAALPAELQNYYNTRLLDVSTRSALGAQEEANARRDALLRYAQQVQATRRQAAGQLVDVGGAMAETGVGLSPAIAQMAIGQVAGTERAGVSGAGMDRLAALQSILGRGATRETAAQSDIQKLRAWEAMQRAALTNKALQDLLQKGVA
jgi:hypothetical protein